MKDYVALVHELGGDRLVVNALDRVMKPLIVLQVLNVLDSSGRKIVDNEDFVTTIEISIGEVRTNESCAAGD
jgi:hypothetical protein